MATWKKVLVSGSSIDVAGLTLGGTAVSSTAAELNILDGVTSTAAELNLVDGASAGTVANSKAVIYGASGEVNATTLQIGGTSISATAAELNQLDDVSVGGSSTGDIVTIDGSQTLTNKSIAASQLSGTVSNDRLDQQLQDVAGLAVTDGNFIVGNGSNFVAESGATARTSLGLGTGNNVTFTQVTGSTALFSGTVSANAFAGDGSALTGVTGDFPTVHKVGLSHDATKFSVNDGSGKFISGSQIKQYVNAGVSGDVTIAADGTAAIGSGVVVNADINASAGIALSKLENVTSGRIIVGNASNVPTAVATSGDVTISNAGAMTIGSGVVENSMLAGSIANGKLANSTISGVSLGSNLNSLSVTANGGITMTSYNGSSAVSNLSLDIDGMTDIGAALVDADLMIVDDGADGTNRKATMDRLATYMQGKLTFTTNTDTDVSVANLKSRLSSNLGTVTIGDANDTVVIAGNLTVQGTKTELQTTNLNVEDQFILLDSGSSGGADSGIIFGGSNDGLNQGHAIAWDDSEGNFGFAEDILSDATDAVIDSKLGNIQTTLNANPSTAPTFQGVGTINVRTDDNTVWIYA